jgi:hypothetical protein
VITFAVERYRSHWVEGNERLITTFRRFGEIWRWSADARASSTDECLVGSTSPSSTRKQRLTFPFWIAGRSGWLKSIIASTLKRILNIPKSLITFGAVWAERDNLTLASLTVSVCYG